MIIYQVKQQKITGSNYLEIVKKARKIFSLIKTKSKRRPYIRSVYFDKEKIFLDVFWSHLNQKNPRDRMRRLKYYACSIDLIKNTKNKPKSIINRNKRSEMLHKFAGITKMGDLFFVQIKENKKTGEKYFMSCFSEE